MSKYCSVDGCGKKAVVELVRREGFRCKMCLEYDLDREKL